MTSNYNKGRAFEYRVRRYLERQGYSCWRSAGSRSACDLIALRAGEVWLIQCKASSYLSPSEREILIALSNELGVGVMLAYRDGRNLVMQDLNNNSLAGSIRRRRSEQKEDSNRRRNA